MGANVENILIDFSYRLPIFVPFLKMIDMKGTKKKTKKDVNEVVLEEKKSKITLYWEDRERRGVGEGEIRNMRAVLK